MGSSYAFKCRRCGVSGDVSGGDDIGFVIKTKTAFCPDCAALVDVSVEYWSDEPLAKEGDESILHRCPRCKTDKVTYWTSAEPCPRCGGEIENRGLVLDWD